MDDRASPPSTPLTTDFIEASSTIEDLTASLTSIHRRAATGTPTLRSRSPSGGGHGSVGWEEEKRELEGELMLCAEIGQALLRRHESYVNKAEKEVGGLRDKVSRELNGGRPRPRGCCRSELSSTATSAAPMRASRAHVNGDTAC